MLTSIFLELLNGVLFGLCAIAAMVFARYLVVEWRALGFAGRSQWEPKMRAALGLFLFFTGESIARGWVWWWRHGINKGADMNWMRDYPVLWIGAGMAAIGILCVIRHFSPEAWRDRVWVVGAGFVMAAVGAFALVG